MTGYLLNRQDVSKLCHQEDLAAEGAEGGGGGGGGEGEGAPSSSQSPGM